MPKQHHLETFRINKRVKDITRHRELARNHLRQLADFNRSLLDMVDLEIGGPRLDGVIADLDIHTANVSTVVTRLSIELKVLTETAEASIKSPPL